MHRIIPFSFIFVLLGCVRQSDETKAGKFDEEIVNLANPNADSNYTRLRALTTLTVGVSCGEEPSVTENVHLVGELAGQGKFDLLLSLVQTDSKNATTQMLTILVLNIAWDLNKNNLDTSLRKSINSMPIIATFEWCMGCLSEFKTYQDYESLSKEGLAAYQELKDYFTAKINKE
ncbi:MAG: hypothetical protein EP332_03480 [Bacteroidetes bacterium]|nr:MAG: hypothetical protein EP332_03480 [Bacteroidota bacterium]